MWIEGHLWLDRRRLLFLLFTGTTRTKGGTQLTEATACTIIVSKIVGGGKNGYISVINLWFFSVSFSGLNSFFRRFFGFFVSGDASILGLSS